MGMVFAVANQKGGVGKTMITLNLAGAYAHDDPSARVLVVDADSQNTSMRSSGVGEEPYPFVVTNMAAAGKGLGREIGRMAQDYDLVLVDCPPSVDNPNTENVLQVANFVLIPMDASPSDAWSTQGMIQLVRRVIGPDPKRCGIVFNKVNTKRASYRDVSEVISEGSGEPGREPPGASGIPSEEKGYKGWVTLPLWESGRHTRLRLRVRPIDEDSDSG